MDSGSGSDPGHNPKGDRGWAILSLAVAMVIGGFLLWLSLNLLASASMTVGGFPPMSHSQLSDAQTFHVIVVYVLAIVSFIQGLRILLRVVRRTLGE